MNNTLTHVNLAWNRIGAEGAKYLADSLLVLSTTHAHTRMCVRVLIVCVCVSAS